MRNEPNLNCLEAVQIRFILEAVPELTSLNSFKNFVFVQIYDQRGGILRISVGALTGIREINLTVVLVVK